jgi:hypothetical protein
MKKGLIILIAIASVIVLVLGYLGYMPIVSYIFGTNRPKDLGVKYTQEDIDSFIQKTGMEGKALTSTQMTSGKSLIYKGQKKVENVELTQEELSYYFGSRDWVDHPLEDGMQIRIVDDEIEFSGAIDMDNVKNYALATNVPKDQVEKIDEYKKYLGNNKAFYLKGQLDVKDNKVNYDLDKIQVGNIKIPDSVMSNEEFNKIATERFTSIPGMDIESFEVKDGKAVFSGSLPQMVEYVSR